MVSYFRLQAIKLRSSFPPPAPLTKEALESYPAYSTLNIAPPPSIYRTADRKKVPQRQQRLRQSHHVKRNLRRPKPMHQHQICAQRHQQPIPRESLCRLQVRRPRQDYPGVALRPKAFIEDVEVLGPLGDVIDGAFQQPHECGLREDAAGAALVSEQQAADAGGVGGCDVIDPEVVVGRGWPSSESEER